MTKGVYVRKEMRLRQTIKRWSLPKKRLSHSMIWLGTVPVRKIRLLRLPWFNRPAALLPRSGILFEKSRLWFHLSTRYPNISHKWENWSVPVSIMNITDLNDMQVSFSVREDLLKDIKIGWRLNAFIPALDNKPVEAESILYEGHGFVCRLKLQRQPDNSIRRPLKSMPVRRKNSRLTSRDVCRNEEKRKRNIMTLKQKFARYLECGGRRYTG